MSRVSVSKSLMVIRAIEKYGAFSKKKKSLKKRLRHKLHIGPSNEEEKQAEDEKRNEKIEQDAREREASSSHSAEAAGKENRKGPADRHNVADGDDQEEGQEDEEEEVNPDMHDGMKKEDMTDKERAERAIALIRSAFSKGLKGEKKQVLKDGEKDDDAPKKREQEASEDKHDDQNRAKES